MADIMRAHEYCIWADKPPSSKTFLSMYVCVFMYMWVCVCVACCAIFASVSLWRSISCTDIFLATAKDCIPWKWVTAKQRSWKKMLPWDWKQKLKHHQRGRISSFVQYKRSDSKLSWFQNMKMCRKNRVKTWHCKLSKGRKSGVVCGFGILGLISWCMLKVDFMWLECGKMWMKSVLVNFSTPPSGRKSVLWHGGLAFWVWLPEPCGKMWLKYALVGFFLCGYGILGLITWNVWLKCGKNMPL